MSYSVLFLRWEIEEGLALLYGLLVKLIRDPYVLEVQEANFHEGVAEIGEEGRLRLGIAGKGQVEDGDRREGHLEE